MSELIPENRWANISASPCVGAAALGWDQDQFNQLLWRIGDFALNRNFHLLFGHDWREDGVMRAIANRVETRVPVNTDSHVPSVPKMLNLTPDSLNSVHPSAVKAIEDSRGLLQVFSLASRSSIRLDDNLTPAAWERRILNDRYIKSAMNVPDQSPMVRNWLLRRILTRYPKSGIRICIGGKTSGYSGLYAGIAEEAFLALKHNMPLYLLAGWGGATAAVAQCLSTKPSRIFTDANDAEPLLPAKARDNLTREEADMARRLRIPKDGLAPKIKELAGAYYEDNGLDYQDNEKLFRTTDLEVALHLVDKGIKALADRGRFN